jgi:hypothetical protein
MRRFSLSLAVLLFVAAMASGCGGAASSSVTPPPPPPGGSSLVSVTMRDTPPAGVTVISFEVFVTGAKLNPGNVDLLAGKGPIQIEVKRLEVETAFLSTASVPTSSSPFTSLDLTFASPELTFRNGSGATLAGCANGAVCEIKPTGTLAATINFPSPGLVVTNNSSLGLQVDVNLNTLLNNTLGVDFSQSGAVSVVQSQMKQEGELEDVDDVFGKVANKGTSSFDLQTSVGNTLTGIQVDNKTEFGDFAACTANPQNFSCVQNGQFVEVDMLMMPGGILLARKVEQENEEANEEELEGIVVTTNAGTNTFQMVAVENLSSLNSAVLGSLVNVSVQTGANFRVDQSGLNVNPALVSSFNSVGSMIVGQNVQVRRRSGDGSSGTPIQADRVRLRVSRFTAPVKAKIDASSFNVDTSTLGLFNSAGITQITVDASGARFEGVSGVSGLKDASTPPADTVSLRGLLFKQPTNPLLVASKVRKR